MRSGQDDGAAGLVFVVSLCRLRQLLGGEDSPVLDEEAEERPEQGGGKGVVSITQRAQDGIGIDVADGGKATALDRPALALGLLSQPAGHFSRPAPTA